MDLQNLKLKENKKNLKIKLYLSNIKINKYPYFPLEIDFE